MFEQTLGSLELHGNAYWFLAGDRMGMPRQIWVLRPDRVTVVPDASRVVGGYLYEIDGQFIPLDALEVIHFPPLASGQRLLWLVANRVGENRRAQRQTHGRLES